MDELMEQLDIPGLMKKFGPSAEDSGSLGYQSIRVGYGHFCVL